MLQSSPLIRNIIILNVVVFLLTNLSPLLEAYVMLWPVASGNFKPYQLFTYMFAHGGLMHIFFNLLALASFGPILESYWGERKFLIFYLVTGRGAGAIYMLIDFWIGGRGPMLGASGAIYGILMAFGMVFPNLEIMLLFPPIPLKAKYMVFVMGFMTWALDNSGTVAHSAHSGAALVAFLLISFWRSQGRNQGW